MGIMTPQVGLIFWTVIIFLIFFILLAKFAWKPIMKAIKDREKSIEDSLQAAEEARKEMEKLSADNEALLREAREEREIILKEAREIKDDIIADAKTQANEETQRMIANARAQIQAEKMKAMTEIKNEVGQLSVTIAEKLLRKELENASTQQEVAEKLVADLNLN